MKKFPAFLWVLFLFLPGCSSDFSVYKLESGRGRLVEISLPKCNLPYQGNGYIAFHTEVDLVGKEIPCASRMASDDFVEINKITNMRLKEKFKNYHQAGGGDGYQKFTDDKHDLIVFSGKDNVLVYLEKTKSIPGVVKIYKELNYGLLFEIAFDSDESSDKRLVDFSLLVINSIFNHIVVR